MSSDRYIYMLINKAEIYKINLNNIIHLLKTKLLK